MARDITIPLTEQELQDLAEEGWPELAAAAYEIRRLRGDFECLVKEAKRREVEADRQIAELRADVVRMRGGISNTRLTRDQMAEIIRQESPAIVDSVMADEDELRRRRAADLSAEEVDQLRRALRLAWRDGIQVLDRLIAAAKGSG